MGMATKALECAAPAKHRRKKKGPVRPVSTGEMIQDQVIDTNTTSAEKFVIQSKMSGEDKSLLEGLPLKPKVLQICCTSDES